MNTEQRAAIEAFADVYEPEIRHLANGDPIEKHYAGRSLIGITAGDVRAIARLARSTNTETGAQLADVDIRYRGLLCDIQKLATPISDPVAQLVNIQRFIKQVLEADEAPRPASKL